MFKCEDCNTEFDEDELAITVDWIPVGETEYPVSNAVCPFCRGTNFEEIVRLENDEQ